MALIQLMDTGHKNFTDENVDKWVQQIMLQSDWGSILTVEYQCEILRCAAELAKFSPWTLFIYIKKYLVIGGVDFE